MEQNVQKQTSGCDSYSLRHVFSATGQGHCLICSGYKDTPLQEADIQTLLALKAQHNAVVKLYYHIPQSLSHYGKVDSLVTAGAMSDFVDYVFSLEKEEAQSFFARAHDALGLDANSVEIIREPADWQKTLHTLQGEYAEILHFSAK